jgi:hypothetical protein
VKVPTPPRDILVASTAVAALVLLFVGLVWYPNHRARIVHAQRADDATQRLASITASEAQRLQLEQAVRDLESGLEADEHFVPTSPQLSAMLRGLTDAARASGVWEQELNTDEVERYADFSLIPASLKFEAGFASAIGVLEAIEKQRRLTAIQSTRIAHVRQQEPDPEAMSRVRLDLDLVSFFSQKTESLP